jgi:hypothetical protein
LTSFQRLLGYEPLQQVIRVPQDGGAAQLHVRLLPDLLMPERDCPLAGREVRE